MLNIAMHVERNEQHVIQIAATCMALFKCADGLFHGEDCLFVLLLYL